jgi:hypothetical protein
MLRLKDFIVEGIGPEILARLVRDEAFMLTIRGGPVLVPKAASGDDKRQPLRVPPSVNFTGFHELGHCSIVFHAFALFFIPIPVRPAVLL